MALHGEKHPLALCHSIHRLPSMINPNLDKNEYFLRPVPEVERRGLFRIRHSGCEARIKDKISPFGRNDIVWFEMTLGAVLLRHDHKLPVISSVARNLGQGC